MLSSCKESSDALVFEVEVDDDEEELDEDEEDDE